jgi:hypothetical protein
MLHGEVGEGVREVLTSVDRVLEVFEDLLLSQQHLGFDRRIVEQTGEGGAKDGVPVLLELTDDPHGR